MGRGGEGVGETGIPSPKQQQQNNNNNKLFKIVMKIISS